jgi:hypothetical protein
VARPTTATISRIRGLHAVQPQLASPRPHGFGKCDQDAEAAGVQPGHLSQIEDQGVTSGGTRERLPRCCVGRGPHERGFADHNPEYEIAQDGSCRCHGRA